MLKARKGSTSSTYQGYWGRFSEACEERDIDPFVAPIQEIMRFVDVEAGEGLGLPHYEMLCCCYQLP